MKYLLENEETQRLLFRKIDAGDFESWLEFSKTLHPLTIGTQNYTHRRLECENWYTKQFGRYNADQGGMNALIERQTGTFIGHAGLLVQYVEGETTLEIAYSLLWKLQESGIRDRGSDQMQGSCF